MCTITQRNKHWISHFTARPFFLRRMFRPFFYFCTSPGLQGRALSAGLLFFFLSHPGNQNKKLTNSGRQKNINLAGTKQIYMDNTSPVFFGRREATKKKTNQSSRRQRRQKRAHCWVPWEWLQQNGCNLRGKRESLSSGWAGKRTIN